ncbi:hypothetical protein EYF80_035963 [Liparis tanakae]|uniref:Uncharacterized protein n=1 Tax=Liparis tanakae TaxID=230148 RepID=A0A4Z2GJS9_9TELE|nr:hypothetical protein EYF80_035963 [Liparis tanakae]
MKPSPHLEDSLGVGRHGGVQRSPAHVVVGVGVGASIQQPLRGVGPGVAGGQVERRFSRAVRLSHQRSALSDQAAVRASAVTQRRQHQWGPFTLTSRQSASRSACGGVSEMSAALRCCRVHSLRSTPPSIAMGSREAVGQPQGAVFVLPLGRQHPQHQDQQDDNHGHSNQLHLQAGVQHGSQGAQEAPQVPEQLLGLQPDHDDQHAVDHLGRRVGGAVQAVPAAGLRVAALVTDAVPKVVRAGHTGERDTACLIPQYGPEKCAVQRQLYWYGLDGCLMQVPPFWQFHGHLCSFSQWGPLKPDWHWQSRWPGDSTQ